MSITINAENVSDAAGQLGLHGSRAAISIYWRKGNPYDYPTNHETGCIVDATDVVGEEVKRCFHTSAEAMRYIGAMLKKHDVWARAEKKKREKEERAKAKKIKQCAGVRT